MTATSGPGPLVDAGFGLQYGIVRLERMTEAHVGAGAAFCDAAALDLQSVTTRVEHIGSSSVVGLLAKPIVDLAVGTIEGNDVEQVQHMLESLGWIYRGDAGDNGGHVFVLDAKAWTRVAHLHVVPLDGAQWRNYLSVRDRLRSDPDARSRYEAVKQTLAERHAEDRPAYTEGKSDVVAALLEPAAEG